MPEHWYCSSMISGLHQIALSSNDLDAAERFYSSVLGLSLVARFDPPGLVFFDLDGPRLLLDATGTDVATNGGTVYLRTADIQAQHRRLRELGVDLLGPPHLVHRDDTGTFGPAGQEEWMMFLRDPDDHLVALVERRPSGSQLDPAGPGV